MRDRRLLLHLGVVSGAAPAEFIANDLADRILKTSQDWGELGLNTAVKPKSAPSMKLRIQDQEFSRGLGSHANGEIIVALDGVFQSFAAEIGVQWVGGKSTASIVFQVFVDDRKKFDSGVMRENDPPRHVSLDVKGTRDQPWLQQVAGTVASACDWIMTQRRKTQQLDIDGEKMPEYGLMPPGVSADWNRYAYRFFNDAQYCTALREAGRVLAQINHPNAADILEDAVLYRDDILRAYQFTQSRTPVVPLADGT